MKLKLITLALIFFALLSQPAPARAWDTDGGRTPVTETVTISGERVVNSDIVDVFRQMKVIRPARHHEGRYSSWLMLCVSCRVRNAPE